MIMMTHVTGRQSVLQKSQQFNVFSSYYYSVVLKSKLVIIIFFDGIQLSIYPNRTVTINIAIGCHVATL